MRHALLLLILIAGAFAAISAIFGHATAYSVAFGATSVMALMIAGTFLWLWRRRETPLALGMSFSWAGAASVLGWWWIFFVLDQPVAMQKSSGLLIFLALYFVGAVQHFVVMQRSMNLSSGLLVSQVVFAIALAALVAL